MITSPTSSLASGVGVVSKLPSRLRSATIIAPVASRTRSSRIDWPARSHVSFTSISSNRSSGPPAVETMSRNAATWAPRGRFGGEEGDEEVGPRGADPLGGAAASPAVAADDVVVAQVLDPAPPPPLRQRPGEDAPRDPLDEDRRHVGKDSDSGQHEDDRD